MSSCGGVGPPARMELPPRAGRGRGLGRGKVRARKVGQTMTSRKVVQQPAGSGAAWRGVASTVVDTMECSAPCTSH